MLEHSAGYQASQSLILFAFPICLPPVGIFLGDYMKHVALLEAHAQFSAWYVRVFFGIIVEICSYVYLDTDNEGDITLSYPTSALCP
jgi:hypothetical protein